MAAFNKLVAELFKYGSHPVSFFLYFCPFLNAISMTILICVLGIKTRGRRDGRR